MSKLVTDDNGYTLFVGGGRDSFFKQKGGFPVSDQSPVLHSTSSKVRNGDHVLEKSCMLAVSKTFLVRIAGGDFLDIHFEIYRAENQIYLPLLLIDAHLRSLKHANWKFIFCFSNFKH